MMAFVPAILPASSKVYLANRKMHSSKPPSSKDLLPKEGVWLAGNLKRLTAVRSASAFVPTAWPFGGRKFRYWASPPNEDLTFVSFVGQALLWSFSVFALEQPF